MGKGSVNHNSRKFKAANVDPTRTHLNINYCNEPIKQVCHKLFDEALERYNAKQTRGDRKIDDYYEKIRSGKENENLIANNDRLREENTALREQNREYSLLRKMFGRNQMDDLVRQAREAQQAQRKRTRDRGWER